MRAGGWFTLEDPEHSLLWKMPGVIKLEGLPNVKRYSGDQCRLGAPWVKPTSWLSNAPWMEVVQVRRGPGCPQHQPLRGTTLDDKGRKVSRTTLAATYPRTLCRTLARAYAEALEARPKLQDPENKQRQQPKRSRHPLALRNRKH